MLYEKRSCICGLDLTRDREWPLHYVEHPDHQIMVDIMSDNPRFKPQRYFLRVVSTEFPRVLFAPIEAR